MLDQIGNTHLRSAMCITRLTTANISPSPPQIHKQLTCQGVVHINISPHWQHTGSWNPSSCKTSSYLYYIVNIIVADVLVMQGARASATMILTMLKLNNSIPACWGLTDKNNHKEEYALYSAYRNATWWPFLGIPFWYPLILAKSPKLIWRKGSHWWNLQVPYLPMFCGDLIKGMVTSLVSPVMATKDDGMPY